MEKILSRKRFLEGKVKRLEEKIEGEEAQRWDLATAQIYDEQMPKLCDEIDAVFEEIFSKCKLTDEATYQTESNGIADRLDNIKIRIQNTLLRLHTFNPLNQNQDRNEGRDRIQTEVSVRLPKLDLPKFSGNVLEWTTFRDLFTSSVHNHPTLAGAEKLKYLKTCLTGEAAELLASFPISDANYTEAWATLQKRYQNIRKLMKAHLNKLLELPAMMGESGIELRKLVDTASSVTRALKALNRPIDENCDLAMQLITNRLDPDTTKLWETHIGREKLPKLHELLDFLDDRAAVLCSSGSTVKSYYTVGGAATSVHEPKHAVAHAHQFSVTSNCIVCNNGSHSIYGCDAFNSTSVADRRAKAHQHNLCLNCLRPGHRASNCFSESSCKKCGNRHHTLLHFDHVNAEGGQENGTASVHTSVHDGDANRALLPTAVVSIRDEFNKIHTFRALIDPGADVSFVSERCVNLLGLPMQKSKINFTGLGACAVGSAQGRVRMALYSRFEGDSKVTDIDAYVIKNVTGTLPKLPCNSVETSHLKHLPLADPSFDQPGTVDLLLGADIYFHTLKSGLINTSKNRPVAQETAFGWVVGGACPSQNFASVASVNLNRCESLEDTKCKSKPHPSKKSVYSAKSPCINSIKTAEVSSNWNSTLPHLTLQRNNWNNSHEATNKRIGIYKDEHGEICRNTSLAPLTCTAMVNY